MLTEDQGNDTPAFILALLTAGGGITGYVRTGSVPSVAAGCTVGALVRSLSPFYFPYSFPPLLFNFPQPPPPRLSDCAYAHSPPPVCPRRLSYPYAPTLRSRARASCLRRLSRELHP